MHGLKKSRLIDRLIGSFIRSARNVCVRSLGDGPRPDGPTPAVPYYYTLCPKSHLCLTEEFYKRGSELFDRICTYILISAHLFICMVTTSDTPFFLTGRGVYYIIGICCSTSLPTPKNARRC